MHKSIVVQEYAQEYSCTRVCEESIFGQTIFLNMSRDEGFLLIIQEMQFYFSDFK